MRRAACPFTRHAYYLNTYVYVEQPNRARRRLRSFTNIAVVTGTGSNNNYAYLVKDDKTNDAVIIDPANPPEYVPKREKRQGFSDGLRQGGTTCERTDR